MKRPDTKMKRKNERYSSYFFPSTQDKMGGLEFFLCRPPAKTANVAYQTD